MVQGLNANKKMQSPVLEKPNMSPRQIGDGHLDSTFPRYSMIQCSSDEEQTPPSSSYIVRTNLLSIEKNSDEVSGDEQCHPLQTGVHLSESKSQTEIEQYLMECSLCYKEMNDPRSLPCQHSFCQSCLQAYINKRIVSNVNLTLKCPVCKRQIPWKHSSIENEIQEIDFPANVLLQSILQLREQQYCTPCDGKKKSQVLASVFCKQCDLHFCLNCKEHHDEIFYNHDISEDLISEKSKQKSFLSNIQCPLHSEVLDYFCCDHNQVLCEHCVAGCHVSCPTVKLISEHLDSSVGGINLSKLNTETQLLRDICKDLKVSLQNVPKHKEWGMTLISNKRREIDRHLDKIQLQLEHDLDEELSRKKIEMERHIAEAERLLHSVSMTSEIMRSPMATKSCVFQLSMCQRIENELRRSTAQLQAFYSHKKLQSILVNFSSEIENFRNIRFGNVTLRTASLKNQNRKVKK